MLQLSHSELNCFRTVETVQLSSLKILEYLGADYKRYSSIFITQLESKLDSSIDIQDLITRPNLKVS